ncbi:helix-turn-helix domain-containing protein [Kitasatospora indigofera]|uniref:helix-turn-helix domain-containing protein n=1 Tax=Kitasatospora indigofera TaxID=67307 RepID=UPI0033A564D2
MTEDKKNPLGPSGNQVRLNVTRIREARGLTKKDVAARTAGLGRAIPALGISRIEAGTRRVDADDLVVLAMALGVNPTALLLPNTTDGEIALAGKTVPASDAWEWADGERPLVLPADDGSAHVDFQLHARPPFRRRYYMGTSAGRQLAEQDGMRLVEDTDVVRIETSEGD